MMINKSQGHSPNFSVYAQTVYVAASTFGNSSVNLKFCIHSTVTAELDYRYTRNVVYGEAL